MSKWDGRSTPKALIDFIKITESFSETPYDDGAGYWTIGYGSTKDINEDPVTRHTPKITISQAEQLIERDLKSAIEIVRSSVWLPLEEHQAAALISLAYNLGSLKLKAKSLLSKVNSGEFNLVPKLFGLYQNAGGKPMLGLRRRRWAEGAIFHGMNPDEAYRRGWSEIKTLRDWPSMEPSRNVNESPKPKEIREPTADDLNIIELAKVREQRERSR